MTESLHYRVTRTRERMRRLGNLVAQYGCTVSGDCHAGGQCDSIALWLDATREYDRAAEAWYLAGRPA